MSVLDDDPLKARQPGTKMSETPTGEPDEGRDRSDPRDSFDEPSTEELIADRLTLGLPETERFAPAFFAVLFLGTAVGLFVVLSSFVADLVVAFILVGMFRRPYRSIGRSVGRNPWVASGITTVLVLCVIIAPLLGLGYTVVHEAGVAYARSQALLGSDGSVLVERFVGATESAGLHLPHDTVVTQVRELAASVQGKAIRFGGELLSNAVALIIHLATVLVMVFYMLVDGDRLRAFLFKLSPLPDDQDALIVDTFKKVSRGVIVGQGFGSLIQGVLGGLSFWAVGLSSPVLWGSVMTLFAFLPLVGVSVVAVPAALYLYLTGQHGLAFGFLAFNLAQGAFIDNVVKTKLIGSAMRMHDLLVFLSVLGGISAFGLIGVVYGPLIAMLFMTLQDLYQSSYRPGMVNQFGFLAAESKSKK